MRFRLVMFHVLCLWAKTTVYGQDTLQHLRITFDGPPPQPPGTGRVVEEYREIGVKFDPLSPVGLDRLGGGVHTFRKMALLTLRPA